MPALAGPRPHDAASAPADRAVPAFALIAAVARNGVIGAGNALPWRLPDDMAHFRDLTRGHAVIMGRRTWESLPRALPGRQNLVVTRRAGYRADGAQTAATLDDALALARGPRPVFCIGGGEIYRLALDRADALYLTEIDRIFDGDATFPSFDRAQWRETSREARRSEGPDAFDYAFVAYRRQTG